MTPRKRNIAASVRDRLLRMAQANGDDFQVVLRRYANERLLARLTASAHADMFVLKGATLFTIWTGEPHRATRDIDLLGFGEVSVDRMRGIFRDVLAARVPEDGVELDARSMAAQPIRADDAYGGVRIVLFAEIAAAKVRLQVDIGCGDAITPPPAIVQLPTLLEFPAPRLRAYRRETALAEKLHAVVELGMANSRMKDFYDLVVLAQRFSFDGDTVLDAVRATFARRGTPIPAAEPVGLTRAFADDAAKRVQWTAFVRKTGADGVGTLAEAIEVIRSFALPIFEAAARGGTWGAEWGKLGRWMTSRS